MYGMQKEISMELRNLRNEAQIFAPSIPCLLRVKENRKIRKLRPDSKWAGWDVHVKLPGQRAGKCVVTLIHLSGTRFI